ncbi:hypothetical protein [Acutalibacter sp.]|jgi:hypothetical protein|uniref:hypothetical protein n=1 Tax=Acutalibacter sp. TaxID=1918636 RepID=UPI0021749734|nr:hypothetical protein [Acutalibacter sp.]
MSSLEAGPGACWNPRAIRPFETACLNTRAALTLEGGLGPDSLVTEKIVVGLFKTALGQPDPLLAEVYQSLEMF